MISWIRDHKGWTVLIIVYLLIGGWYDSHRTGSEGAIYDEDVIACDYFRSC